MENWARHAVRDKNLIYAEFGGSKKSVVLGDPKHKHSRARVVYGNAPQSMRNIEEETGFQT